MPLHDVGYRPWQGRRSGSLAAILVIASTGIKLAWTSRWLRRAVFFAWSPALVFAGLTATRPEHVAVIVALQPSMTALATKSWR